MSWHLSIAGRDKAKLKEAVRAEQCKDEEKQPHNGVPKRVCDHICDEIDRVRIYEYSGKTFGVQIQGSGSFSEQGMNETLSISAVRLPE